MLACLIQQAFVLTLWSGLAPRKVSKDGGPSKPVVEGSSPSGRAIP